MGYWDVSGMSRIMALSMVRLLKSLCISDPLVLFRLLRSPDRYEKGLNSVLFNDHGTRPSDTSAIASKGHTLDLRRFGHNRGRGSGIGPGLGSTLAFRRSRSSAQWVLAPDPSVHLPSFIVQLQRSWLCARISVPQS